MGHVPEIKIDWLIDYDVRKKIQNAVIYCLYF